MIFLFTDCSTQNSDPVYIVPESGYSWPDNDRGYWPTDDWQTASMEEHGINASKMVLADDFAKNDPYARALLVVKDGYLVYENYYGDGGIDKSTNLWSVTKSFSSALTGIIKNQGYFQNTRQYMADLLPQYPEFEDIKLHHVLTHSTGLHWNEEGPKWVEWIFSDDWVASALARGFKNEPGEVFKYSSGNTHFLTSLAYYRTNNSPGVIMKEKLFDPMGIPFEVLTEPIEYGSWEDYKEPLYQSWRRDTKGIETASFGLYLRARDMAKFGYLYLNRGRWEDRYLVSEGWVINSTKDHMTNIYGRYSYGYQWYLTMVGGQSAFLASGFGGQIIGVVPSLDLVVVLKYEAEDPVHPVPGTTHDDMHLFELVVNSVN
jgi:CubicO group peptidase (beta-lactamase class C family)